MAFLLSMGSFWDTPLSIHIETHLHFLKPLYLIQ